MHFPEPRPDQTEERILPLINVVFLLLIFFMIAGSLSVSEPFEVKPPVAQSAGELEPESLVILLSADGRMALDNEIMTEAELMTRMTTVLASQPQTQITLKADARLAGNRLVRFTQALNAAGVQRLQLVTLPESQ